MLMNTNTTEANSFDSSAIPSFPVVGIGASAGGLEAVSRLLMHLPADLDMAYVFIQHLKPTHESLLSELLARTTPMEVHEATNGMLLEANHVYIIPPNTDLTLTDNRLALVPQAHKDRPHLSIDTFLFSLAENQQHKAIGVILSGTAFDGTKGLQAIKAHGGLTFAQEPASATYAQMPQNAIAAGCVDWIGTPEEIAGELSKLSQRLPSQLISMSETSEGDEGTQERVFRRILRLLHQRKNVDFTAYKPTTLKRRMLRRIALRQLNSTAAYLTYLQDHPEEVEALYQDMLIGVTGFFRDQPSYQRIINDVLPHLISASADSAPLRVWVPGCSTGEEVYSLAICVMEFFSERSITRSVQFFGTDINSTAIVHARAGIYSEREIRNLSAAYRERYFQPVNGSYQVNKSIRDLCVFAQHNLLADPPFSRLDLISCRNVLIYLETEVQYKVAQIFHYALLPHGVLQLGSSESMRIASDLFTPLGERTRSLYLKKANSARLPFIGPVSKHREAPQVSGKEKKRMDQEDGARKVDLQVKVDHLLLARYAPASVVIDEQMEIIYVRGSTSPYLEAAPGRASFNIFKMAREGLGFELRTVISQVRKSGQPVRKEGIPLGNDGGLREVAVEVIPMKTSSAESYFLILFEEALRPSPPTPTSQSQDEQSTGTSKQRIKDRRIQQLEQELAATRHEMRSVIEELEAANEELQSANEESLSSNEELQSLNEELETSKEEIQSSNEELLVINQELTIRNAQVQAARVFAESIVATIRSPLLVLNRDLQVQQANEAFYQCFQLSPDEVIQRHFFTLGQGEWNIPVLQTLLEELLPQKSILTDYEVETTFKQVGHKILLFNAQRIDSEPLLLLAIEDITLRRQAQEEQEQLRMLQQREEFLAIASHELKTPVTSIKGYTQLMSRYFQKTGDEYSTTLLARMDVQVNKLVRLIGELLDTSKIEAGKLQWHHQLFNLATLTHSIVEEMEYTQPQHQIRIEGATPIQIFGDPERIGQVLTNLLSNAIKYSPESKLVVVKLQTSAEEVTVSVQDFGIGIDPQKCEHIFERFFRVNDAEHVNFPGLGLGLYISAEIVKEHKGRMWVESQPGTGSTFFFTLPLASSSVPNLQPEKREASH